MQAEEELHKRYEKMMIYILLFASSHTSIMHP
jgi:hypothetical protein